MTAAARMMMVIATAGRAAKVVKVLVIGFFLSLLMILMW